MIRGGRWDNDSRGLCSRSLLYGARGLFTCLGTILYRFGQFSVMIFVVVVLVIWSECIKRFLLTYHKVKGPLAKMSGKHLFLGQFQGNTSCKFQYSFCINRLHAWYFHSGSRILEVPITLWHLECVYPMQGTGKAEQTLLSTSNMQYIWITQLVLIL